jgi:type I restriction enzyme S subunit
MLYEVNERATTEMEPPVLTLTERNGFVRQSERFKKRLATEDTSRYKLVRRDDIAFNPYLLWAGAVAQNTVVDEGITSPLYPTFRARPGYHPQFIARMLLAPEIIASYDGIAFGSVPRRRRTSTSDFLSLVVPGVPHLEEQRRIAAILDSADAIRSKRKAALAQLDSLTQAVFSSLFALDSLPHVELGALIGEIDGGASPNCENRRATADEWGVLKLGAVTYGRFQADENKAFTGEVGKMSKNEVRAGDVLMTRKNTRELVGAVSVVDEVRPRLLLPDLIFRLHLDKQRVDPRYFQAFMMNPRTRHAVRGLSSGSASSMPNISKARLRSFPIALPPIADQQAFAACVARIEAQRVTIQRALAADDELFASLQSRAFSGKL